MRTFALIALAALLSLHAAEPGFKLPAEYSCTMVAAAKKGEMKGKIIQGKDGLRRMEMTTEHGAMTMIMRPDRKQMIMLMDEQKMAMTLPLNPAQMEVKDPTADPNATWTKTGTETVNGVECAKYEYTSGGEKGTAWVDAKQNVPVRIKDAKGQSQIDFTDYKIGPQKAELFEVPAGYQAMAMPGAR